MTDSRAVLEVLQGARDLVSREWGTCNLDVAMSNTGGCTCASVAISTVCGEDWDLKMSVPSTWSIPAPTIKAKVRGSANLSVYRFNDRQPSVTPVLAAFDKMIASLEPALVAA